MNKNKNNEANQLRDMKTVIVMNSPKSSNQRLKRLCRLWLLLPVFMLSSCMETIFTVQFPEQGKLYIDDQLVDFVITYNTTVPSTDVYLNGTRITNEFSFGPSQAVANIANIKKYIREGSNTLTVDPLAFGPTVTFRADTIGPETIVTNADTTYAGVTPEEITITGIVRDPSDIASLGVRQVQITGYDEVTGEAERTTGSLDPIAVKPDGSFSHYIDLNPNQQPTLFNFEAEDIHGHKTTKEYLYDISGSGDALRISNAMRMAIGDTFVASLRPIIANALFLSLQETPIDVRDACWDDPNKGDEVGEPNVASQNPNGGFCTAQQDGSTFNPGLNPVNVDIGLGNMPTTIKRLFMQSGSTVLLNQFEVQANNILDLDMVITDLRVNLDIDGGWLLGTIGIDMTIDRTVADTGARTESVNKQFEVELVNSDFILEGITMSELSLWGINLSGLVNILVPILEGIIADLLPSILNPILEENLNKVVIGARMIDETDPNIEYFDWALNVETFKTDNLFGANNPYDMIIGLETVFDLITPDPNVATALGPKYVEDPVNTNLIYNSLGDTGTNLSFALSSNALNQAFAALYGAGLTHISIVNGETTYGADPSLPAGTEGQTRIRLYPSSPPFFTLRRLEGGLAGEAEASVGYEKATLYMDLYENGAWKVQMAIDVEFTIAASLLQQDNAVRLGVSGSPEFIINDVINNTAVPVTQSILQGIIDIVTVYALPELTDNFAIIDLDLIAQNSLNGTVVPYQSDQDNRTQVWNTTTPCNPDGTINGTDTAGGDGIYDLVCEEINLVLSTNAVTSIGDKGSNLFFQMELRDPDLPAAPAIPRLDLDGDGLLDYQDNCSPPVSMLSAAVFLEGGLAGNVDADGNPIGDFEDRIAAHVNRWVAMDNGVAQSGWSGGKYLSTDYTLDPPVAGTGTPTDPDGAEITWWNSQRKGDDPVTALGTYKWTTLLHHNINQMNTDGDRVGELCENDDDRDGIYSDNGTPTDLCPSVSDPTNDPGACAIDLAEFVMFQNQTTGQCLEHFEFSGADDTGTSSANFTYPTSTEGVRMGFANCDVNDLSQRFYVELSPADASHSDRFPGDDFGERIIYIYTNEWKQIEPGFYDLVNMHYVATTIANVSANGSSYWGADDVIVTTMAGYDDEWREWILTESGDADGTHPYFLESHRTWLTYGDPDLGGDGRRDCIFKKSGNPWVDLDANNCINSPADSSFQIFLGQDMVKWTGLFSTD